MSLSACIPHRASRGAEVGEGEDNGHASQQVQDPSLSTLPWVHSSGTRNSKGCAKLQRRGKGVLGKGHICPLTIPLGCRK